MSSDLKLCGDEKCRRLANHQGNHNPYPNVWQFLKDKDSKKINKAGFATPRGGAKGGYQNHVVRSNKVIIPFERLKEADLTLYEDGYIVRLLPEQYFKAPGKPKAEFLAKNTAISVGKNAFVLYRTYDAKIKYPPLKGWKIRTLLLDGSQVDRRSHDVQDTGEYLLRLASTGAKSKRQSGPPQGIFAPEYANREQNYLAKCVLTWLIVYAYGSPYTSEEAKHLRLVLAEANLENFGSYETRGVLRHGLTSCPLCLRVIRYDQLHTMVNFDEQVGLVNAGTQVAGATRSTEVNLFHIIPLVYGSLQHIPNAVGWGHANCNTRLGQRRCYSLSELQEMNLKVGILRKERVDTIGWISKDYSMIRSSMGAVWVRLCDDMTDDEQNGIPPASRSVEDEIVGSEDARA